MSKSTSTAIVYYILNQEAKAWWYHKQLRQQGKVKEARELERKSILSSVETLRGACFATVGRGGWSISYVGKYGGKDHMTKLEGYGGIDEPMIRACILLGIPVCDSTTIPDNKIVKVISFPLASHPEAGNLDSPPYGSMAYAPFGVVFEMYKALGATIYNGDQNG